MLGVPLDVVLGILDAAASDPAVLKACCLVSHTFSTYAQALLFRSVRLETYRRFSSYSSAIDPSTNRGRALGELTRNLSFSCEHGFLQQYERLALRDFAKLLPGLPKLHHLELYLRGPLSLNSEGLEVLSRATSVRSLHLHNFTKFGQTVVHDILAATPQVTTLRLDGSAFRIVSGREPLALVLSELHWCISLEPSAWELKWLLGESSDLRALSIDIPPENRTTTLSERLLQLVLQRYGPNLQSLHLSDRVDSLDFVQLSSPNVTDLLLRFWPTSSVLASLPSVLKHLGIARPDKTVANEPALLVLMSSLARLPALRTLAWVDEEQASTNERTVLKQFCDTRDIAILEGSDKTNIRPVFPRRTFGKPVRGWVTMPD